MPKLSEYKKRIREARKSPLKAAAEALRRLNQIGVNVDQSEFLEFLSNQNNALENLNLTRDKNYTNLGQMFGYSKDREIEMIKVRGKFGLYEVVKKGPEKGTLKPIKKIHLIKERSFQQMKTQTPDLKNKLNQLPPDASIKDRETIQKYEKEKDELKFISNIIKRIRQDLLDNIYFIISDQHKDKDDPIGTFAKDEFDLDVEELKAEIGFLINGMKIMGTFSKEIEAVWVKWEAKELFQMGEMAKRNQSEWERYVKTDLIPIFDELGHRLRIHGEEYYDKQIDKVIKKYKK